MSCSPLLHPAGEGGSLTLGFWGWSNTWHPTLDGRDGQPFISRIYPSPGEEDTGVALRNRVNPKGLQKASFVVKEGWGIAQFSREDVPGLFK